MIMATTAGKDRVEAIDSTVQKTYGWLHELGEELGGATRPEAYHVLRGFLHTLRDRLVVDEAADVGAQLPMLIRGLYYEAWDPSRTPRKLKVDEFVAEFVRKASLEPGRPPVPAIRAAAAVLRRHVSQGEMEDVLSSLPVDLRALLA
jgi:uncharacterized protein (DUF2267 family)